MKISCDYAIWGETVRMARLGRRMTQQSLAALVGVSSATMCRIENGTNDLRYQTVISICAVLDIAEPEALTIEGGEI